MKIAYVTMFDATDVRNWSGLDLHIWKSLESQDVEVELIGNLKHGRSVGRRLRKVIGTKLEGKSFLHFWDLSTARDYAADVAERLKDSDADIVLSPSPIPLAYLECSQPRILWTDATFAGLASFYPEFLPANVCAASIKSGHEIDRLTLQNCDLSIYSSAWAADTARVVEPALSSKVHMVPYGANVEVSHTAEQIAASVELRIGPPLRLLFIGMDWQRKGGDLAVAVAEELICRGMVVELVAVGAQPPEHVRRKSFVKALGIIDKSSTQGTEKMTELLTSSHFLILPSIAECCAVVLSEACAFGLPIVATDVGGMSTAVIDGENGKLFALDAPAALWADWICQVMKKGEAYGRLANGAFAEYQHRLNWDTAGRSVMSLIAQMPQLAKRHSQLVAP